MDVIKKLTELIQGNVFESFWPNNRFYTSKSDKKQSDFGTRLR